MSGLVLGLSGAGRARISLGTDTALDLRAGASIGYAPGHEMFKASVNTSACVNHMINYSTFTHACLDMSYRSYDLGETFQSAARVGFGQVFSSAIGTHEARVELKARHVEGGSDYDQKLASLALTSAIPGPYAINLGFQFGEKVEGVLAMRERVSLGVGFKAFERPTSITLAAQSNRGGMWLGQDLSETVTSISMAHQVSEKITVSGYVAQTNSSDSFFDDTQFGLNIGFRF